MGESSNMLEYANAQVASRLGALAFEVARAGKVQDADAVHDLRVSIRRFSQSLTVFSSLLPKKEMKRIRRRLKEMMDAAGEIRDRDIALEFLDSEGVERQDPLRARIASERAVAEKSLIEKAYRWSRRDVSGKWRTTLHLNL